VTEKIYVAERPLSEQELLLEDQRCPLCACPGERPPVMVVQENPRVSLLACGCGCISASRMPKPEYLRDYYRRYYSKGMDGSKGGFRFPVNFDGSHRLACHLFRCLDVPAKKRLRILDFGGGVDAAVSRALARSFVERGTRQVEIALVDYNASCSQDGGAVAVNSYPDLESAGGGFDAVIASAILEHIPYPREIIRGLLNSMAPGSRAYFRTPSMTPVIKLASRFGVHIDFTYPNHVHDMGQAFWENLLVGMGGDGFTLFRSRPALVEADFRAHPARAAISFLFKCPWFLLRSRYRMVGGWEAIIARAHSAII
jgi:2-polyprenyl-3-methyl-5-hydroxy-6-metoxy-1,4-benzoquinol methylase